MTDIDKSRTACRTGLSALSDVQLTDDLMRRLDEADSMSAGPRPWRYRKRAEAEDLMKLSQIAPKGRMQIEFLEMSSALRAAIRLKVPVPCMPDPYGELCIFPYAILGLTYPVEALRKPLPGAAFIQIMRPQHVWLANVLSTHGQPLCLGTTLPAGVRVKELILMAYGGLAMQNVQIDEADPAGVMNIDAARWWQHNLDRIPLSPTPFLRPEGHDGF